MVNQKKKKERENKNEVNVEKGRKVPSDSDGDGGPVARPSELFKISPNTYVRGQPPTRQNKPIQGKKQ